MTPNPNPSPELPKCRYCGGAGKFQVVSPVSDHAWATCFCSRALTPPTPAETVTVALPGAGEVRFWQQAIGTEIARQCGIGAGTCGNADDGSGLFEVNASLDLNGFAAAMKEASFATVAAANDEGVARIICPEAWSDADTGLSEPEASQHIAILRRDALAKAAAIRLLSQGVGK